jgi:hypothetical protein
MNLKSSRGTLACRRPEKITRSEYSRTTVDAQLIETGLRNLYLVIPWPVDEKVGGPVFVTVNGRSSQSMHPAVLGPRLDLRLDGDSTILP